MKKVMGLVSLILAISLGACVAGAPEPEATEGITATPEVPSVTAVVEVSVPEALILRRGTSLPPTPAAATCNEVYGPCRVGRCEFANDTRQNASVVCCNEGVCTVQNFVICGC